jgi:hypothetical protein
MSDIRGSASITIDVAMVTLLWYVLLWSAAGSASAQAAGPTGSAAPALEPLVRPDGLKRIEIDAPGEFFESNAHYVLMRDIVAERDVLRFGRPYDRKVANCIVDLNGHTVTYNTEDYDPDFRSVCRGIRVFGPGPVEIRNGIILQGDGRNAGCHGIDLQGTLAYVHDLTIKVYGPSCTNIDRGGGGTNGRIHDNYLENHSTEVAPNLFSPGGIVMSYDGRNWEVYSNTVIGGHRCIEVRANARERHDTATRIHHNRLAPRRTHGIKAPHAIMIYTAEQNEIFENLIDAIDARGINVQMGSRDNYVHHNLVAARYSTVARGNRGYIENRCYAYWERSGGKSGNRVTHNVFIVSNATRDDATSDSRGVFAGTGANYPEPLLTGEYSHNLILCRHDDPAVRVSGMVFKRCGKGVLVEGNRVFARTVGIDVGADSSDVRISNNILLKPSDADDAWTAVGGDDAGKCLLEGNRTVPPQQDTRAPSAPRELQAVKRPGAVELRWKRNAEEDIWGYRVYRDGKAAEVPLGGANFWVDLPVKPGASHTYAVTAVDLAGNESESSETVRVTLER